MVHSRSSDNNKSQHGMGLGLSLQNEKTCYPYLLYYPADQGVVKKTSGNCSVKSPSKNCISEYISIEAG